MTPEDKKLLGRILSRAEEEGDCLIWRGAANCTTPIIKHLGQSRTVRPILAALWGLEPKEGGRFWVAGCGVPSCIKKQHLTHVTQAENHARMSAILSNSPSEHIRRARISATKRERAGKLTGDKLMEMIAYPANCAETAEVFGVGPSTVSKYRRRGTTGRGVFAGLGAR